MSLDLAAALVDTGQHLPGMLGVAIRYLPEGPTVLYNADELFPTASVIKVPVLVEVFSQAAEGAIDLQLRIPLRQEDLVEGSGVLQYLQPGAALTIRDLAELMIIVSDNTATNMLIEQVGVDAVNARMLGLGLSHTLLGGKLGMPRPAGEPHHGGTIGRSVTTPREMCQLFELLWRGELVSTQASSEMLQIMGHQNFMELARYLPVDDLTEDDGRRASAVLIASKSGSINGVRNDVGLITAQTPAGPRQYIVSAFTRDVADARLWTPENVALRTIGEVSHLAYQYLLEQLAG